MEIFIHADITFSMYKRATNFKSRVTELKIQDKKERLLQCARFNIKTIWCFNGGEFA